MQDQPAPEAQPAEAARPGRRTLRAFGRDQRGVTIIEFGFIVIPFAALIAAIIEISLMYWASSMLEEAAMLASRPILTGEAATRYANPATAATQFKTDLCARVVGLFDCQANVTVDVKAYTSFANADTSLPISGGALNTAGFGYSQVGAGQIAVVRAVLEYPVVLTGWNQALAKLGNGNIALMSTITFRTEPYTN